MTNIFKTEKITSELITNIVQRIVQELDPEKIYLFGSYARRKNNKKSDLDLFVVMKSNKNRAERSGVIRNLISPRYFPLDVVVYTPEEFEKVINHKDYWFDPFVNDILKDGIKLYEK